MALANFAAATKNEINNMNNVYTNARYAPTGAQHVGIPFPAYKQSAGQTFTDWRPAGSGASTIMKEFNLPTNTNFFRQAFIDDAVGIGNNQLSAWVNRSQTLATQGETMACNNNDDCSPWPGTTCNSNYEPWPDAKGNQSGSYCAVTLYPEMENGQYFRKLINEGGIGKACTTDGDCGQGYACNNETDFNGKNVQQTGYCAQTYQCPDGSSHYLGYPYNSGIPQPPPNNQNNDGQGYRSEGLCLQNALGQQNCVQGVNGSWYAIYPGYCPVPPNLRVDGPKGRVSTSSPNDIRTGFHIPAYATTNASNFGSNQSTKAFTAWNIPSGIKDGSIESWEYARSLDPKPPGF